ncbi:TIGR03986 family type III CRISPR-associated RAMP protein [Thermostaphylospora chromogena]|uniref:CRISPR-associated protein n=1 Tax=Thermostaphylospora chromogena TaxID=35622 RepID=A0A1H1HEH8_9ACTN|nr:TIGR03986 family CRISPR-associated RAMP protein [Thermostaphylospora chromogena]SDR23476.1 CRISPR-associated protein [Thermostaphylospora chromogena]
MTRQFLNPYTFIPAFPRKGLPTELTDGPPPSRDVLRPTAWTGRIGVTLTVETPLLLLDTARHRPPAKSEGEHKVYPVHLRDGRPHLAATSVKGMLRAGYEAITNSRFGVFDQHDTPLGFRRGADYALDMVPVYIAREGMVFRASMALLELYDKDGRYLRPEDEALRHGDRLRAVISDDGGNSATVLEFAHKGSDRKLDATRGRVVEGIAYVTGPNIEGKRFERFFYLDEKRERLPLARPWEELVTDWKRLIADYRNAHDDAELHQRRSPDGRIAGPGERIGAGPGQLAWSPQIHDDEWMTLKPRSVCYARLCDDGIERFYPVMIPRDLYPISPRDLLDESLLPAPCYEKLSPADRVFGWVAPKGSGVIPAAYRGRLRIGPVVCDGDASAVQRFAGDGLPLAILGRPKPQQGRFYLSESKERPDKPIRATSKEDLYREGRGLRGRKAYWHHAGLDAERHWDVETRADPTQEAINGRYREYRRPYKPVDEDGTLVDRRYYATIKGEEQRDTQNRSIEGWVKPGTTFHFTIEVRDLDTHELGALAWLLTLPEGHYHRLGLGRPLGFGSVRLDVDPERTELHSGADYQVYYRTLSGNLPDTDGMRILQDARAAFLKVVDASPALRTIRDAMLAVARGNPDLPVHYPRTYPKELRADVPAPPDPRGRNFTWFTENERMEKGRNAPGRGRSLPSPLDMTEPLQVYEERKGRSKGRSSRKKEGGYRGKRGHPRGR